MIGLLGHAKLADGEALVFPRCNSIHTIGMRFAIDVVFVDQNWSVVSIEEGLVPGRLIAPVWNAWGVIEAASGASRACELQKGDLLELIAIKP
jgi:uncharacterized protein